MRIALNVLALLIFFLLLQCFFETAGSLILLTTVLAVRSLFSAKRWSVRLFPLSLLILLKISSFYSFSINHSTGDISTVKKDLLERRQYLLEMTSPGKFSESDLPLALGSVFQKEWSIGTLSMTAAALTNIAFLHPETAAQSRKAVAGLVQRMLKQDIRNFEKHYWGADPLTALDSSYGQIGYLGHLNFMLGAFRFLGGDKRFEPLHHKISATLARRIEQADCPYLETFPKAIFVPDNMVVAASLNLYNRIYHNKYSEIIKHWVSFTRESLVHEETGLLFTHVYKCKGIGIPRGSFSGWNSFYLPFIDEKLAQEQYTRLRTVLFDSPLGIPGIREYPHGRSGAGDIDSGPVILGLSTSGTGFAVAGARHANDLKTYNSLLQTAELAGTTIATGHKRWYAFAPLVGQAIMLAMKTAGSWELERFVA